MVLDKKIKLNKYVDLIKNCTDDELIKYGVRDNWAVDLKTDFKDILNYFEVSDNYILGKKVNFTDKKEGHRFCYKPGTVEVQICNFSASQILDSNYNSSILLHVINNDSQDKKIPGVSDERAMAIVIEDIENNLVTKKNIENKVLF